MSDGIEGKARGRLGVSQTNRFSLLNCCIIPNPKRWPFFLQEAEKKFSTDFALHYFVHIFCHTEKEKKRTGNVNGIPPFKI